MVVHNFSFAPKVPSIDFLPQILSVRKKIFDINFFDGSKCRGSCPVPSLL